MAAKNENVALVRGDWTLITAASTAVTAVTIDNVGSHEVIIMATADETAPADGTNDGIRLAPGLGIKSTDALLSLFPGITPARVYALCLSNDGEVFVSHAA